MANIDLNKVFKQRHTLTSPVDSFISLNKPVKNDIIYSDFKLDLTPSEYLGDSLNSKKTSNDIAKIINEESILNSIRNILSTRYHSRLLNPELNFDLRRYLFENITEAKAFFIGYEISSILPIYEPRLTIDNIEVIAYYNYDTYGINIDITIPSINKSLKISSILNSDGFTLA